MTSALLLDLVGAALLIAAVVTVLMLDGLDAGRDPDGVATSGSTPRRRRAMNATTVVVVVVAMAYAAFRIVVLAG